MNDTVHEITSDEMINMKVKMNIGDYYDKFFISDTHFNDGDIIKLEDRPFKNTMEMNTEIIKRWNNIVGEHDTVYHLGDVGIHDPNWPLSDILSSLNGNIIVIRGNHDMIIGNKLEIDNHTPCVINGYYWPICIDDFYWLSHEPMYLNKSMPYVNIHGHIHSNTMSTDTPVNRYVNVSVEAIDYQPIRFGAIKERFIRI